MNITKRIRDILGDKKNKFEYKYRSVFNYYGEKKLDPEQSNHSIKELLLSKNPIMISRFGSSELNCLMQHIKRGSWDEKCKSLLEINAGFFPATDQNIKRFSELYLDNIKEIDLLGIWYSYGEDYVYRKYCPEAKLIALEDLEPFHHDDPWSEALENKKVLIVHPFEKSIKHQYTRFRKRLFKDSRVLPDFDLRTIQAVQSVNKNKCGFNDWFEALSHMCNQIDNTDYDIAIIGAGAYGLPLAAHVKKSGKKAIHMGGASQLLFGIKGARWDQWSKYTSLYNEFWIRPLQEEYPPNFRAVEGGCYW